MNQRLFFLLYVMSPALVLAQTDSVTVEAREWSRDKNRQIQYSDWKPFRSMTVDRLPGFKPDKKTNFSQYGGDGSRRWKGSGFFRTERVDGRWWLVDPTGHPFVTVAVNSVRAGQSANNKLAFDKTFGSSEKWVAQTQTVLEQGGFVGTGSWSEVDAIRKYNQTATKPIVYTTMLGFLTAFERDWKKSHPNAEYRLFPYSSSSLRLPLFVRNTPGRPQPIETTRICSVIFQTTKLPSPRPCSNRP